MSSSAFEHVDGVIVDVGDDGYVDDCQTRMRAQFLSESVFIVMIMARVRFFVQVTGHTGLDPQFDPPLPPPPSSTA